MNPKYALDDFPWASICDLARLVLSSAKSESLRVELLTFLDVNIEVNKHKPCLWLGFINIINLINVF